jgi:glycosyltransferase involved in cell wall biosynthesis
MTPRVSVLIPALDEEHAIGRVLAELPRSMVHEVVVVDNGSTDRTAAVAAAAGARVVREPRRGYGQACLTGLATLDAPDVIVFLDADHSDHADQLAPVLSGEADLVIGSRRLGVAAPGSMTWPQRVGNRVAPALIRLLFGQPCTDLGPFRALRASRLAELGLRDVAYGWTVEMQVRAAQCGLRTVEVPVDYRARVGRSKVSGTLRGVVGAGLAIPGTIVRLWWRHRRRAAS